MEERQAGTATYGEALEASKNYFNGNDLAAKVFVDKYAVRNKEGNFLELTPDAMHDRLADAFAKADVKYGHTYSDRASIYREAVDKFARIVPQGSPMAAVGNNQQLMSASNCVVVASPMDDMGGIIETGKELAQLYKRRCGVGVDISTLRPEGATVNNAAKTTSGAWSFADFYSYITRLVGQCIAEGERVLTSNGLKEIQNVIPGQDKVWTKKGWVTVRDVVCNGQKRILKITSREGFSIKTSKDHVFLTECDGDVVESKIGDLTVGDSIVLIPGAQWGRNNDDIPLESVEYVKKAYNNSNRLNEEVAIPSQLTGDLAYFLGYSYGDGHVPFDRFNEPLALEMSCAHDWPNIEEKLKRIVNVVFSYDASVKCGDGAVNIVSVHSKLICGWLKHNGLLKDKSTEIRMPSRILKASPYIQMSFLAGFFDADGYNGGAKRGYIFSTVSKEFAYDIQTILMANGIISKVHKEDRTNVGWRNLYSVAVTGRHAQQRIVSMPSVKVAKNRFCARRDNYLTPFKAATLGVSHSKYAYIPDNTQFVSANAYLKLSGEKQPPGELYATFGELLIKSSVKSIESVGRISTYDLVLDEEHLFWCEGFYVHNSGRRGALMITMSVHHPDVLKFTTMKHDLTKVTGANVSLRISDEFLEAVDNDEEYELRWPVDCENPKYSEMVSAREVWNQIVDSATTTAEPGLIMWDSMVNNLPAHCYEDFFTISTNPCSEIALSAYDSCRLISINLTGYVRNAFKENVSFDFRAFRDDVRLGMQMADNLVDIELGLIDGIRKQCNGPDGSESALWGKLYEAGRRGRRTGLGTHGLADTLAQLKMRYDGPEALEMVDKIYKWLRNEAYNTSIDLAIERGAFPDFDWEKEKDCEFIKRLPKSIRDRMAEHGRRNIALLTQAPTGSVSILSKVGAFDRFNVSSGVEPVFRNSYTRRKKHNPGDENARTDFIDIMGDHWEEFEIFHSNVNNYFEATGNEKLPDYFVTSDQIDWQKRIDLQGVEQQYVDHSISSTINLPKGTVPEVVGNLYLEAWRKGLKGVTVYVDGSRDGVLITDADKQVDDCGRPIKIMHTEAPKRPAELMAEIHHAVVNKVKWTVIVGLLHGEPYELFMGRAEDFDIPVRYTEAKLSRIKQGLYNLLSNQNEMLVEDVIGVADTDEGAWITRLMSMSLRHGVPIEYIADQLSKDGCVVDLNKVLARLLKKYVKKRDEKVDEMCPACGGYDLVYEEGCKRCIDPNCGWAGCG